MKTKNKHQMSKTQHAIDLLSDERFVNLGANLHYFREKYDAIGPGVIAVLTGREAAAGCVKAHPAQPGADGSGANSHREQTILAAPCRVQARSTAFQTAGAA